ncbi:MAG TPA: PIN domain-containing protein, partial [Acidimicrobiales bacterium]
MTDHFAALVPARPRTYVLDTSVLLADPRALVRFDEHHVVLPIVVLMELEAKRDHPELGWAARHALRHLERLRVEHGSLTVPLPVNDHGGTLRVELNHQSTAGLPATMTADNNDHRILAVAFNLREEGHDVTVVTKDLPLRLKASIVGLEADEYRNELASDTSWTGFTELPVQRAQIDELFTERVIDLDAARSLPCNTGIALHAGS